MDVLDHCTSSVRTISWSENWRGHGERVQFHVHALLVHMQVSLQGRREAKTRAEDL